MRQSEFGVVRNPKGGWRFPDTHVERAYHNALKHWQNYIQWRANRNPDRARREENFGYDTKHAAHLLRLYRMGIEILTEEVVRVRRPDAAWLRQVLDGRYSYPELMNMVTELRTELAAAEMSSNLPAAPDTDAVEALLVELHMRALHDERFQG